MFPALGKGATRIRIAGLHNLWRFSLYGRAEHEGIAAVARLAIAHGTVAEHTTLGSTTTETRTRILAAIVQANQRQGTIRIGQTLGSTVRWRAEEVLQAGTGRSIAYTLTLTVGTAGRRLAGITGHNVALGFN